MAQGLLPSANLLPGYTSMGILGAMASTMVGSVGGVSSHGGFECGTYLGQAVLLLFSR